MKKLAMALSLSIVLFSCSESSKEQGWTEQEEVKLYTDCRANMAERDKDEEISKVFCTCCLEEVKRRYKNGKESMKGLTPEEVKEIELGCVEKKKEQ